MYWGFCLHVCALCECLEVELSVVSDAVCGRTQTKVLCKKQQVF